MKKSTLVLISTLFALAACHGGHSGASSSAGGNAIATAAANVATITVSTAPGGAAAINHLYTTVTLCAPGSTTNCQTIDHVEVDTGTSGLRVLAGVLSPALASALPLSTDTSGNTIVECMQFADGYAWGPVATADLTIASEKAASLPIQVIGSTQFPTAPAACSGTGPALSTVASYGANGTLGIAPWTQDCGSSCALSLDPTVNPGFYYACSSATQCTLTTVPATAASGAVQLVNPVTRFATDSNGVIIELPQASATGSGTLTGALVFGVDTQTNNATNTADVVLTMNPANLSLNTPAVLAQSAGTVPQGQVSTTLSVTGTGYGYSFFDTGSSAIYFSDPLLTALVPCTGPASAILYCPTGTQNLSAVVLSTNNVAISIPFSVANADTLLGGGSSLVAFGNLAGTTAVPGEFDWGLPFFLGRNIYLVFEGRTTTIATGPYISF